MLGYMFIYFAHLVFPDTASVEDFFWGGLFGSAPLKPSEFDKSCKISLSP